MDKNYLSYKLKELENLEKECRNDTDLVAYSFAKLEKINKELTFFEKQNGMTDGKPQ